MRNETIRSVRRSYRTVAQKHGGADGAGVRWKRLALIIASTAAVCAIGTFLVLVLTQGSMSERGSRRSAPHSEIRP
jgi:hypothetical protein